CTWLRHPGVPLPLHQLRGVLGWLCFPQFGAHSVERKIHMVQHPHGMTVTVTTQEGEAEPQRQVFSYSWASLRGLLGEAASLLLLRVLACHRAVPPGITFPAIDKEGHLCTTTYRSLGVQQQPVGSTQVEVLVVERALHAAQSIPMVWHHSLLPSGYGVGLRRVGGGGAPGWRKSASVPFCRHLARQVQVGCPVVAVLQDAPALSSTAAEPQPLFPKQLLDWKEDAQLCSWFLDRKLGTGTTLSPTLQEELRASHSTYVQQHPELFALLADFLQALLLRQPPDPILFAAEFFAPFARRQPPGPSFASSVSLSPFCSISRRSPPAQGD
ncbi:hypothetical protein CIB84_013063, partial [Bambusicola thoracicus]